MVGNQSQGWAIFAVMGLLFLAGVTTVYRAEAPGNPAFAALHVDQAPSALQAGGNMEGKEVRFGIANSVAVHHRHHRRLLRRRQQHA